MRAALVLISLGSIGVIATACTSLQSVQIENQDNTPQGLTYRLPAKQFTVKAEYEITGCATRGSGIELAANVKAQLSESLIGSEAYTIDYEDLNTWTKITSTEFQLSEAGLLTGVNATISDQSGAVIASSISGIASIARAVALPNVQAAISPSRQAEIASLAQMPQKLDLSDRDEITAILNEYTLDSGQLDKIIDSARENDLQQVVAKLSDFCFPVNEAIEARTSVKNALNAEKSKDRKRMEEKSKLEQASQMIAVLTELRETYYKLGNQTDKDSLLERIQLQEKERARAIAEIEILGASKTAKLTEELSEANDRLSISVVQDFVPMVKITSSGYTIDSEFFVSMPENGLEKLRAIGLEPSSVKLPAIRLTVMPFLSKEVSSKMPEKNKIGIAYRIPVASIVRIEVQEDTEKSKLLLEKSTQVPQYGPVGSINLKNIMFDDNLIELAFNATTGSPSRLKFTSKAKAEAAAASLQEAGSKYSQLQSDKNADQIAINKALMDQATAQIALAKASSELDLTVSQDELAKAKALAEHQKLLVETQSALLREQQRLEAIRTGTATAAEIELEALKNHEELLAHQLRIIKIEQEIALQKSTAISDMKPE